MSEPINTITPKKASKGSNVTKSPKPSYYNTPLRAKSVKKAVEQLQRFTQTKLNRAPSLEEKCAAISLTLPLEKDNNRK